MIWVFLILLILFFLVSERLLARKTLEHIRYEYSLNRTLAEPEETVTAVSTIRNTGKIPALYLRLLEYYPDEIQIRESQEHQKNCVRKNISDINTIYKLYLLPHRKYTVQFHFSVPKRGVFRAKKYYLEAGDFFGLQSKIRSAEITRDLVVMPRRCDRPETLRVLGGFIGDISVRRLILEDPVLAVGYHEYTGREPMKDISWKQTARMNQLQVKIYDHTVESHVAVVLNTEFGTQDDLETCFEICRTVCEELEKARIPYEFHTNGDVSGPLEQLFWLSSGLGNQHLNTILYGLGKSKCLNLASFSSLVDRTVKDQRTNRSYIVITPSVCETVRKDLSRLQRSSSHELCLLIGTADQQEERI